MDGCDVRAVTAWSLFGAYNWDTLLTRTDGSYECGAFDVRGAKPRPTAIARLIRAAVASREPLEPDFDLPGWWQRPEKILYRAPADKEVAPEPESANSRPVTSHFNLWGGRIARPRAKRGLRRRSLPYCAVSRAELDITDPVAVRSACDSIRPWAIINAAGYVRVDDAEQQSTECFRDNVRGPEVLAGAAHHRDIALLTFSSDLVFDGRSVVPYVESSPVAPLNIYGQSKRDCELATLRHSRGLCVRTAAFFGAWGRGDFLSDALLALSSGRTAVALSDVTVSPTYVPDLAQASLDLLIDGCTGVVHLANRGALSWAEFLERGAERLNIDTRGIKRRRLGELNLRAARPLYSALASERVFTMPTLEDALDRYSHVASSLLIKDHRQKRPLAR